LTSMCLKEGRQGVEQSVNTEPT